MRIDTMNNKNIVKKIEDSGCEYLLFGIESGSEKIMKYKKLVRDKIPEIIRRKGGTPITHIASDSEYWAKLKEKLGEEVAEFLKSEDLGEIADILEVLDAIVDYKGFHKREINNIKKNKAKERGKFKNRIILDES